MHPIANCVTCVHWTACGLQFNENPYRFVENTKILISRSVANIRTNSTCSVFNFMMVMYRYSRDWNTDSSIDWNVSWKHVVRTFILPFSRISTYFQVVYDRLKYLSLLKTRWKNRISNYFYVLYNCDRDLLRRSKISCLVILIKWFQRRNVFYFYVETKDESTRLVSSFLRNIKKPRILNKKLKVKILPSLDFISDVLLWDTIMFPLEYTDCDGVGLSEPIFSDKYVVSYI